MTDLQLSLFAIGGVILVGVVAYNKWQENKARRTLEDAFPATHDDVLMSDGDEDGLQRHEPVIDPSALRVQDSGDGDDDQYGGDTYTPSQARTEPGFADAGRHVKDNAGNAAHAAADAADLTGNAATAAGPGSASGSASGTGYGSLPDDPSFAALAPLPKELPVDELIDAGIPIALESQVRGEKILPAIQNLRYVGNKPVHFIGRHVNGDWEAIAHGGVYQSLMVGVQLANRSNPLNELEYSELVMRLRQFTDGINAEPELPDMTDIMTIAQSLHQFIIDHDVQLGVNVQSNGAPWAVNTLVSALTRQGFDLRTDGTLVMQDGEGEVLFSLSTNVTQAAETTDRLTLLLDVPRVGLARDGYGALVACARSLAMRLGGKVVDDSNQPLTEAALSDIEEQVAAFYAAMASAEIPAGSSRAMRLFS